MASDIKPFYKTTNPIFRPSGMSFPEKAIPIFGRYIA
jgi:hypothetical protein